MVYSSDMTSKSCYSMATIVTPPIPITMTTLATMTSIPSPIYGTSTVTFIDDIDAYTTVDIN
jgi:hypothetical protein